MSSASKALELLSYFSADRPRIGLSQLCRLAHRDKATTYRHLQALEVAGFVEQDPGTKQYRLGPALIQLAQVREETVPRKEGAQQALAALATETGETAHISILSGTTLYGLASCESPMHGARAVIDISTFPLHATASGIAALAFGPHTLMDVAVTNLAAFTDKTPSTPAALQAQVDAARDSGFGCGNQSFETEICGVSAPVFDQSGAFAASVAVASVASRFSPKLEHTIKTNLVKASHTITRNWGGRLPPKLEILWADYLSTPQLLDAAS